MPRTRQEVSDFFKSSFERIMELRREGQKEYAHQEDNAFANFERAAADLDLDRKMVLWIFAMKHRDGIASHLKGHESQREDVTGRIQDLIVYLFLLWAMIEDERSQQQEFIQLRGTPAVYPFSEPDPQADGHPGESL